MTGNINVLRIVSVVVDVRSYLTWEILTDTECLEFYIFCCHLTKPCTEIYSSVFHSFIKWMNEWMLIGCQVFYSFYRRNIKNQVLWRRTVLNEEPAWKIVDILKQFYNENVSKWGGIVKFLRYHYMNSALKYQHN